MQPQGLKLLRRVVASGAHEPRQDLGHVVPIVLAPMPVWVPQELVIRGSPDAVAQPVDGPPIVCPRSLRRKRTSNAARQQKYEKLHLSQ